MARRKEAKLGIEREDGRLYFVGKRGNVESVKAGRRGGRRRVEAKTGIKKVKGRLYFLDRAGDVSSAPLARR
jgi:hypothetical protein